MAEITPTTGTSTVVPNPTLIKRSEMLEKAKELKDARTLPPKTGSNVSLKEMNDWIALLTPEMMADNRLFIYVYRLDPIIIRQKVDPSAPNNIDVITDIAGGVTEQYMIERHGGGKYQFTISDNEKSNNKTSFFTCRLTISQTAYPPKLDYREVDWDSPNNRGFKAYCKANRLIDDNNMPITPESAKKTEAIDASNATIAAMKLVMDYTSRMSEKQQEELKKRIGGDETLSKTVNEIILEKMKQDDPNKQLNALTTILTAVKSMQPEIKPDNTLSTILPIFMQMIQQMNDASSKQFQMMMEVMKSKGEGADKGSVISEVKELFNLFQDMNGTGGGKKSTAEVIGSIVENNLTPVLQIISQVVTMKAAANGLTNPLATPGIARENVSPSTGVTAQPVPDSPSGLPAPNEAAQIIAQFGPVILNYLAKEGWEFGAWVADGFEDATAMRIARMGTDTLLAAAKMVPQFWQRVEATYGEAYMRKWLDSFVHYKEEMMKPEDDEDDEEVIVK